MQQIYTLDSGMYFQKDIYIYNKDAELIVRNALTRVA